MEIIVSELFNHCYWIPSQVCSRRLTFPICFIIPMIIWMRSGYNICGTHFILVQLPHSRLPLHHFSAAMDKATAWDLKTVVMLMSHSWDFGWKQLKSLIIGCCNVCWSVDALLRSEVKNKYRLIFLIDTNRPEKLVRKYVHNVIPSSVRRKSGHSGGF